MEDSLEVSQNTRTTTLLSYRLLSIYIFKENEIRISKKYMNSQIHCHTTYNSQGMEIT